MKSREYGRKCKAQNEKYKFETQKLNKKWKTFY